MTLMMNGNHAKTLLASIVSITLFACSSGSDTGDEELDAASFTRIGVISVDKTQPTSDLSEMSALLIEAEFFASDSAISLSQITTFNTNPNINTDSCELEINDDSVFINFGIVEDESIQTERISAGDIITISGTPGTVANLLPIITGDDIFGYTDISTLDEADSMGLTADIPGSEFPAFSQVSIPDIEPFVLTGEAPTSDSRDIDAVLTWTPSLSPNSYIRLSSTGGPDSLQLDLLDCLLVDDGSFELPPEIQSQLASAGLISIPMDIGRQAINIVTQADDTVLFVIRSNGGIVVNRFF